MTRLYLRFVIISIFIAAAVLAIKYGTLLVDVNTYFTLFTLYLVFSVLFVHLRTLVKTGSMNVDYSISYSFSFVLLTGPLGLFLFELVNRFYVYFHRKITGTADEDELLHTFYNIGGPVLFHSFGFYCFQLIYPMISSLPFAFWLFIFFLTILMDIISSCFILVIMFITKNVQSKQEAIEFITGRSMLDLLKTALTNALLFTFITMEQWEAVIAIFLLSYIVGRAGIFHTKLLLQKQENERFKKMAYTDFLTNIHNRAYMNKVMKELNSKEESLAVVIGDIDSFKSINDTFNHIIGDGVIQHFAKLLQKHVAPCDYVFRTGGEEFTIILRNKTYEECQIFLEQLKNAVLDTPVQTEFRSKAVSIPYTASFGMYYIHNDNSMELKKAYMKADELLLDAKHNGKNKIISQNSTLE
ncbi:GGDEF domain-containing protein [Oceanobacillus sojae]|uniref:GGDEF domain-containing protein n=1 Tax=Oceanobacillus sojae TaxID=582851 RepID=UPI0009885723|nr:GGDEF domain-containing protein [Oceanobacillus sojae]MCT1901315.1 GGDEF domain-containing protein [Oceanobacillus sojae]